MRRFLLPLADTKYTPSPSGSGSLDMLVIKVTPLTQDSLGEQVLALNNLICSFNIITLSHNF